MNIKGSFLKLIVTLLISINILNVCYATSLQVPDAMDINNSNYANNISILGDDYIPNINIPQSLALPIETTQYIVETTKDSTKINIKESSQQNYKNYYFDKTQNKLVEISDNNVKEENKKNDVKDSNKISSKSNIDKSLSNEVKDNNKNNKNSSVVKASNSSAKVISTYSAIKRKIVKVSSYSEPNIEYVDKVFDNSNDKISFNNLLSDLENRNYEKIYNDFYNGNYKEVVNNYIKIFDKFNKNLRRKLNTKEFKDFLSNLKVDFEKEEYSDFKKDIDKVLSSYKDEVKELNDLYNSYRYKEILINFNDGKYKNLVSDIKNIVCDPKYKEVVSKINDEFLNGKYAQNLYNIIYEFFDITYKYKDELEVKEEEKVVVNNEKEKEIVEEKKNALSSFIVSVVLNKLFIPAFCIILLIFILLFVIIKLTKLRNKNFMKKEQEDEEKDENE